VPVVDIQGEWNKQREPNLFQPGNHNHVVAKGADKLAKRLLEVILSGGLLPMLSSPVPGLGSPQASPAPSGPP
jgi:hypothetical protein